MSEPVVLYQGPRAWGHPNVSPFCTKVELFLRAAKIQYRTAGFNPTRAPKGKMPYILFDGQLLPDSSLIIEHLVKKYQIDWDRHLSPKQKAIGHLLKRTLEEATYFCELWNRWGDDDNWKTVKSIYFGFMPAPIRAVVPEILRRKVKAAAWGQGVARYSRAELSAIVDHDFSAIAEIIGSGPFALGEQFTTYDCTAYAFLLAGTAPMPNPLSPGLRAHPNLTTYLQRVKELYFAN